MKKIVMFALIVILGVLMSCKDQKQSILVENVPVETIIMEVPAKKTDSMITKDFVLGKFDYKAHEAFEKVSASHSSKTIYLNKSCYKAFKAMHKQAKTYGINLIIISGTRNFYEQKSIWERKWKKYSSLEPKIRALKILEYSSMPTSSRHHWGTDMDLNNLTNSYFEKGEGLKIYNWLLKHAKSYGFKQVYTEKINGRTGYNLEKWHWSYMPLAETYLEFYNENISYTDIIDFKGFEQAQELDVIKYYVNGISKN
ncbi:M15 family metallopeptidase [Algibacter sp. Ld11]|uniref:M15 family metallopeptidase n=1 Tax=Algibacter sp. Ld11 TaxID=649150 RepID=UPI00386ECF52